MVALAPLNILVILNTHVPEVLGDVRLHEEEIKQNVDKMSKESEQQLDCDFDDFNSKPLITDVPPMLSPQRLPPRRRDLSGGVGVPFGATHGGTCGARDTASAALVGAMGVAVFSGGTSKGTSAEDAVDHGEGGGNYTSDGGGSSPGRVPSHSRGTVDSGTSKPTPGGTTPWAPVQSMTAGAGTVRVISSSGGGSSSSRAQVAHGWRSEPGETNVAESFCRSICPDMVMVPRRVANLAVRGEPIALNFSPTEEEMQRTRHEAKTFTLVLSHDNIAALLVISSLSVLGAIYLWKICTRRRCSCRLCKNQYRTLHLLGSGGYGSVHLVDRLGDGMRFALKKIPVREITEVDEYSREAKELIKLRHRHIVSYEDDFVHVEYGALEPKMYFIIIMEHCPEGDLKEKIEVDFYNFTEEWVRTVFAQLLQAVQYLHSKNVIHRDLKSQNVFLAHDGRVRLGDFGLCRRTPTQALGESTLTHAGTDCYMAPEMLSSSKYGKPADMWSLGCVLYELCTGVFMWELDGILGAMVMKNSHTVQKLVHENMVPAVGNALKALLKRLLSISPVARPTVTTCIRKKVFKRSFPLSHQPFGESLGEVEGMEWQEDENVEIPSTQYSNCSMDGTIEGSDSGSADGSEQSSDDDEEEAARLGCDSTPRRNDDLPRRRHQRRRGKRAGRR